MDANKFLPKSKQLVADYANQHLDVTDNKRISEDDVYVVWSCKTLQNSKALLSTNLFDGMYYELTFDGNKDKIYFDAYKKFENRSIDCGPKRGE